MRERRRGDPVNEIEPETFVIVLAEVFVAEHLRVGHEDDAALAVLRDADEAGIARAGLTGGAEHDGRVAGRATRTALVKARFADLVHQRAIAGRAIGEEPRGIAGHTRVAVEHSRVFDFESERFEQFVEIVAVLVVLVLADDEQAAAVGDELLDRRQLRAGQLRTVAGGRALPFRVARMQQREHVGLRQRVRQERFVGIALNDEIARGERVAGHLVRRIAGTVGLHFECALRRHRPAFAVRFVEQHADKFLWRECDGGCAGHRLGDGSGRHVVMLPSVAWR